MRFGLKTVALGMGAAIVVVGGAGIADASGGPMLRLGHNNKTNATTTLTVTAKNKPALSLQTKGKVPPLTVNSNQLVPNLNSQLLDGLTATQVRGRGTFSVIGPLSGYASAVLCPKGTHPVGGGVLPSLSSVDAADAVFTVASIPNVTKTGKFNGWFAAEADSDGSYDGTGYVAVECQDGLYQTQSTLSAMTRAQAVSARSRAALAIAAHERHLVKH